MYTKDGISQAENHMFKSVQGMVSQAKACIWDGGGRMRTSLEAAACGQLGGCSQDSWCPPESQIFVVTEAMVV